MSVTSKLKKGVDIPVFEWLRSLPATAGSPSQFSTGGKPYGRYIYYQQSASTLFYRYDTYNDSWMQLTSSPTSNNTVTASRYNDKHGYFGRVISSPSVNTIQVGVPRGNKCVGMTIKITSGTGAGQSRTITGVSEPTIHDTLVVTNSSSQGIIDSSKTYVRNIYRDYVVRIIGNTATDFRKILSNTNNTLQFSDNKFSSVGVRWAYSDLPYTTVNTAGSQTIAQIESYVVTVDSDWDISPDSTSQFVIESGGIWTVNSSSSRFVLAYYDILADSWYRMTSPGAGYMNGQLATDVAIETLNESAVGTLSNGNVVSATTSTVTTSVSSYIDDQYSNYVIRITSGTGIGQDRIIESNTSNTVTLSEKFKTAPDNTSTYDIISNNEKMFLIGNAASNMYGYEANHDFWSDRKVLEVGCPNNMGAIWNGYDRPVSILSITRITTTATATTVNPHGLKVGDVVSVYGATDPLYNVSSATITAVNADNTFDYTMAGTPAASAVASFVQTSTLLVDSSKNWTVNELVGKVVTFTTTSYSNTTSVVNFNNKIITANTATTISFATTTSPIAGNTVYAITELKNYGSLYSGVVSSATTSAVTMATGVAVAVNQYAGRRIVVTDGSNHGEVSISSHTAGTNPVFTLTTALAFTPTANSSYASVLEMSPTSSGCSLEYLYNTTTLQKGKYILGFRGANTNNIYQYDITANLWSILNQCPNFETFTTGSMTAYDGDNRVYVQQNATGKIFYYDFTDNTMYNAGQVPYGMSAATLGNKMSIVKTEDGLKFLYLPRHNGSDFWRLLLWT